MAKRAEESVYQVKIVLEGSKPPIWRRLLVNNTLTLAEFHTIIQNAMGWENDHLFEFTTKEGTGYSIPFDGEIHSDKDADETELRDVLTKEKEKLSYVYDFGDCWEHAITLEKILPIESVNEPFPVCTEAVRACPPEDIGGIYGYYHFLEVINNPEDPEYEDFSEIFGEEEFDPEAVDIKEINKKLEKSIKKRRSKAKV